MFMGHTAHLSMQLIHKSDQNSFMKSNTNRLSKIYLVEFILLNKIFQIFTMHYIFKRCNYLTISAIWIKNLCFNLWCFYWYILSRMFSHFAFALNTFRVFWKEYSRDFFLLFLYWFLHLSRDFNNSLGSWFEQFKTLIIWTYFTSPSSLVIFQSLNFKIHSFNIMIAY